MAGLHIGGSDVEYLRGNSQRYSHTSCLIISDLTLRGLFVATTCSGLCILSLSFIRFCNLCHFPLIVEGKYTLSLIHSLFVFFTLCLY